MSREAMKQALEALESVTGHFTRTPSTLRDSEVRGEAHKAITALRQALVDADDTSQKRVDEMVKIEHDKQIEIAQAYERGWNAALAQQEPVAWLKTWSDGSVSVLKTKSHAFADHELEPLYAAPQKRDQAQDAVLAEREACAKICADLAAHREVGAYGMLVAHSCANEILARGQA